MGGKFGTGKSWERSLGLEIGLSDWRSEFHVEIVFRSKSVGFVIEIRQLSKVSLKHIHILACYHAFSAIFLNC